MLGAESESIGKAHDPNVIFLERAGLASIKPKLCPGFVNAVSNEPQAIFLDIHNVAIGFQFSRLMSDMIA